MISIKKLLLFVLKQSRIQDLKQIRFILSIALTFLLAHNKIEFNENAEIVASDERVKKINKEDYQEYNEILKKAEMLGKWLSSTSDVKSIYSFLRITP